MLACFNQFTEQVANALRPCILDTTMDAATAPVQLHPYARQPDGTLTNKQWAKLCRQSGKWNACALKNELTTKGEKRMQEWMKTFTGFFQVAKAWLDDNDLIEDTIEQQQPDDWHGTTLNFIAVCKLIKGFGYHNATLEAMLSMITKNGKAVNQKQLFRALKQTTPISIQPMATSLRGFETADSAVCSGKNYKSGQTPEAVEFNSKKRRLLIDAFWGSDNRYGPTTHRISDSEYGVHK